MKTSTLNRKTLQTLLNLNVQDSHQFHVNSPKELLISSKSPLILSPKNPLQNPTVHKRSSFSLDLTSSYTMMMKPPKQVHPARVLPLSSLLKKQPLKASLHSKSHRSPSLTTVFCEKLSKENKGNFENYENHEKHSHIFMKSFREEKVVECGELFKRRFSHNGERKVVGERRGKVRENDRTRFERFLKGEWGKKQEKDAQDEMGEERHPFQLKKNLEKKIQRELENMEEREKKSIRKLFISSKQGNIIAQEKRFYEAYDFDLIQSSSIEKPSKNMKDNEKILLFSKVRFQKKKNKFLYQPTKPNFMKKKSLSKQIFEKICNVLLKCNKEISQVFQKILIYPKIPFYHKGSYIFIESVKKNRLNIVKEMMCVNPSYLLDFDHFYRTPLHWACYYGYFEMVKEFYYYMGSNELRINMRDIVGSTPLYLACRNNHISIVKFLILNGGNLWSYGNCKFNEENIGKSCFLEIKKGRKLEVMMKLIKNNNCKKEFWRKEAPKLFII